MPSITSLTQADQDALFLEFVQEIHAGFPSPAADYAGERKPAWISCTNSRNNASWSAWVREVIRGMLYLTIWLLLYFLKVEYDGLLLHYGNFLIAECNAILLVFVQRFRDVFQELAELLYRAVCFLIVAELALGIVFAKSLPPFLESGMILSMVISSNSIFLPQ